MNINPKILGLTFDPILTYNTHIEITTTKARNKIHILKSLTSTTWKTKGNNSRNIQSHNKTHTRVRFHHMVTTSIRHKHQQTTDNTALRIATGCTTDTIHKHTTSTRRNTHATHKGTPPTTRITDKTPNTPTTLHHNITNNPDIRNKQ